MKMKVREARMTPEQEARMQINLERENRFWNRYPASVPKKEMTIYKRGVDGKFRDDKGNLMGSPMKEEGMRGEPSIIRGT